MRRPKLPLLALAFASLAALAGCSVQEVALIPRAIVRGRITVPDGERAVTVRVNRVGTTTERTPPSADFAFTDVQGDFLMKTEHIGTGFVVARGPAFDIAFSPVFLEDFGETFEVESWLPQSTTTTPTDLIAKVSNEALFLVFEEDFTPTFGPIDRIDLVGPDSFDLDDTAIALHDDGSTVDIDPDTPGMQVSGDVAAGDKVWTIRVTETFPAGGPRFPAGDQPYAFYINGNTVLGEQRDPYEESSDRDDRSLIRVVP